MPIRLILIFWTILAGWFLSSSVKAQDRCSTTRNEALRRTGRETTEHFEQWMKRKLEDNPQIASVYTIPVVVHVLHNGTGDQTNISDAQILSQIDVLNKDFKRLNLDASNTPLEFQSVAGSIDIDFVLAKRDPEGLPTNGITRTLATKSQWSLSDQTEFKALSYWPAEDYLNIWVIRFGTNDIGFAQFPVSNTLAGLQLASEDRLTDGVVVDYRAFGTQAAASFTLYPNYNQGRTATHEIGHFLGLRHIWGDVSSCGDNDFVPDTPPQTGPTTLCPSHPQVSCSGNKMFMNYMDYSNDNCMNVYTQGQVARMIVVLSESPRRASLLSSLGATVPIMAANDLGIRQVIAPETSTCGAQLVPQVQFRNYGTNTITSATFRIEVTGFPALTTDVPLVLNLTPGGIVAQTFNPVSLPPGATYEFTYSILNTNGGTDGNSENDQLIRQTTYYPTSPLPILEPFETVPTGWIVNNPDNLIGWEIATAPDASPSNQAMKLDFYNYEIPGVLDWVITPAFTMTAPGSSLLRFDIAYAQYPGQSGDALRVYALPDCSTDLTQAILLYDKSGSALATSTPTSSPFMPVNATQWRKSEVLSLSGLSPATGWQLAFIGNNGYGNNLYLDNVAISEEEFMDIALSGILSPGIVHCKANPSIGITVTNLGTFPITEFSVKYFVPGLPEQNDLFNGVSLDVGETNTFNLSPIALRMGANQVSVEVSLPAGITDLFTDNNNRVFKTVLNESKDIAPLRLTFDNPNEKPWVVASPVNSPDWQSVATNKAQSISYRSFTNPVVGQESWLVSPTLDLTAGPFSLFFDVSYAQNVPADDRLLVLGSVDCGVTYTEVLLDRAASSFTTNSSSSEWSPNTDDDWRREYLSLGSLPGSNNIRIAFVVKNDNGNNLYLDNIELYKGDDPNPPTTPIKYQLYYSSKNSQSDVALTLNLDARQDVRLQIFGIQGNLVADHLLTDALNQTYYFDLSQQAAGLYIFRLLVDNKFSATKVFIGH